MPVIRHKFATQTAADAFARKLVKRGFFPHHTMRTKIVRGLKRYIYEVEYTR